MYGFYTGCDGSAEPQANLLEVPAAFNPGQVWLYGHCKCHLTLNL